MNFPFATPVSYTNYDNIKQLDEMRRFFDDQVPEDFTNNLYKNVYDFDPNSTTKYGFQKDWGNQCFIEDNIPHLRNIAHNFIMPEIENYGKTFLECMNIPSEVFEIEVTKVWHIEYFPNSWQEIHNHNECHFSCVFYVWSENLQGGDLCLINPSPISYMFGMPKIQRLTPKTGDLIIMPGWLEHKVDLLHAGKRTALVFDVLLNY